MKKFLIAGIIALITITAWYYIRHPIGEKAIINGQEIRLMLAVTEAEKEKGLGYRDALAAGSGMLFVYDHPDRYGFWMKGMRFPLDFIWINGNKVADISQNIPQPVNDTAQPVSLAPKVPADKVLEVNAGVIQSLGIRVGDLVQFVN
ncbi:MAG: DUF192 domain-containing protein [Candidatus Gottesmanbacteria bacterium]|nr:DUF192 domain-containing protein [Candidatus Gottesmanbacteria bacterium]